jgi:cyclopropane-fatty-acyl-phospholipid synthase
VTQIDLLKSMTNLDLRPSNSINMTIVQKAIRLGEILPWPDKVTQVAIDFLVSRRSRGLSMLAPDSVSRFAEQMERYPIAEHVAAANMQHYEIPEEFFGIVLGPQRKYSCCLYDNGIDTLSAAEELALRVTAEHAGLSDGQSILELGCGWGSLSLWMARHYPAARIVSVSNSRSQRDFITRAAKEQGLSNLDVVTSDMNDFEPAARFDRIVSVEMFEHMANWRKLFERLHRCIEPDGRMFIHIFSNRKACYRFSVADRDDWIAQHYFTGGIMPSHDLIGQFADCFIVEAEWRWSGRHYQRTAAAWLQNMDSNSDAVFDILKRVYGREAPLWYRRWRLFFLATMGLFGHAHGEEWGISHYRMTPAPRPN